MRVEDKDAAIAWELAVLGFDLIDGLGQFTHANPAALESGPHGRKGASVLAGLRSWDGPAPWTYPPRTPHNALDVGRQAGQMLSTFIVKEKTMTTFELDMPRFVNGHCSTSSRKRQGETSYA
jgi:hypothetical protein